VEEVETIYYDASEGHSEFEVMMKVERKEREKKLLNSRIYRKKIHLYIHDQAELSNRKDGNIWIF
jgi:hypothetical protein